MFSRIFVSLSKFIVSSASMPKSLVVSKIFFKVVKEVSKKTKTKIDDNIIKEIEERINEYTKYLDISKKIELVESLDKSKGFLENMSFHISEGKIVGKKI